MIELNPLVSISKEIRAWTELNRTASNAKREKIKKAVEALSKAVLETKAYVRNGFQNRNLEKENEIRDLWNKAHVELRSIDSQLAKRCFLKAEYWTEPDNWDMEKVERYNITLDSMSKSLKEI